MVHPLRELELLERFDSLLNFEHALGLLFVFDGEAQSSSLELVSLR